MDAHGACLIVMRPTVTFQQSSGDLHLQNHDLLVFPSVPASLTGLGADTPTLACSERIESLEKQLEELKCQKTSVDEEAGVLRDQVDAAKLQIESVASKIQDFTRGTEESTNTIDDLKAQLAARTQDLDKQNEELSNARWDRSQKSKSDYSAERYLSLVRMFTCSDTV